MLNRTNRTLSANLNRLNLGTRSFALAADVNNGGQTLRIRHAHRFVKRDGMLGYPTEIIPISEGSMPAIPSPSSGWPRHVVPVPVVVSVVATGGRPDERRGDPRDQASGSVQQRRSPCDRRASSARRSCARLSSKGILARVAPSAAAARFAASGG